MGQWLVRDRGGRAHIWDGSDTICRMYSTGGLKQSRYELTDDRGNREVCLMCHNGDKVLRGLIRH